VRVFIVKTHDLYIKAMRLAMRLAMQKRTYGGGRFTYFGA
jgi:hypothetical protein